MTSKLTPAALDLSAEACTSLRKFWETGVASRPETQTAPKPKSGRQKKIEVEYVHGNKTDLLKGAATRLGVNFDTLKKSWRVAQEYSREQIEGLCDSVLQHRSRFGPTHLIRLLAVKNRKKRDLLTSKAIRERWSVATIEIAIQASNGARPTVGRNPNVPSSEPELLSALHSLTLRWTRWCSLAETAIPADLSDAVHRATVAVAKVQRLIAMKLPSFHDR